MATNDPKQPHRHGAVKDRYQVFNETTQMWEKYTSDGEFLAEKATPWKGVRRK